MSKVTAEWAKLSFTDWGRILFILAAVVLVSWGCGHKSGLREGERDALTRCYQNTSPSDLERLQIKKFNDFETVICNVPSRSVGQ